jgi:choline dehydrogenase-like flavoprotein
MSHIDGRHVPTSLDLTADLVVVGSGPAGCSVARAAAACGASVIVVEAGPWVQPNDYPLSTFSAMSMLYRNMGASLVLGSAPIPYVQGRMVGGSSPINGAICWRMPRDVHDEWCRADPALRQALPWDTIESVVDEFETRLNVRPTDPAVAGRKNLLLAKGAEALGLEHRPIRRNVRDCQGLGRCMQGCPHGHKQSVDANLLADAMAGDTTVLSSVEVRQIVCHGRRADAAVGRSAGGGTVRLRARRAIVLAASAVQTPVLLLRSGLRHGPVGENFQCHPGVSMAGRFHDPVRMWEGATQGHEVVGLRHEGLKFEALGFDLTVLAARLDGVGSGFARTIADMAHWLDWGVAVRAQARGRVRFVLGQTVVTYSPTARDVQQFRRGLRVMGEMMFAAGAEEVAPGVRGFAPRVTSPSGLLELEKDGPRRAAAFTAAITHMFGTCRMGSDPATSVVRPDFRHHAVESLYVADSSVFPTNLGVNPQIPIMALATLCARRVMAATS